MNLKLNQCLPCPEGDCPEPIQDLLNFSELVVSTFSDDDEGRDAAKTHAKLSFLLRRLWTFALASGKPLALMVHGNRGGVIFGLRLSEGGTPEVLAHPIDDNIPPILAQMLFEKMVSDTKSVVCQELQEELNETPDGFDFV